MGRDTTSSNTTLPIGQVFKSSGTLVYKHIFFWLVLVVVLHFVSWRFVTEIVGYLKIEDIIEHGLGPGTEVNGLSKGIFLFVIEFGIGLSYFTLLQVIASQLIYDQLVCRQKEIGIGSILQRFKTTDFLFDVLRTIGITAVYYGIFFAFIVVLAAVFFFGVYLEELQTFPILTVISSVVIYILFLIFLCYILPRLYLAVPLTVVENKKILESLKRSWRMTASCRIRMPIVVFLTGVLTFAIFVLPILVYGVLSEFESSDLFLRAIQIFVSLASLLSAIVMAVCYCYLRSAEDRDNNPPELNTSD